MFHEYKRPIEVKNNNLFRRFKKGAIVFGRGWEKYPEDFVIYGTLPYGEKEKIDACVKLIREKYPEDFENQPVQVREVAPTPRLYMVSEEEHRENQRKDWDDVYRSIVAKCGIVQFVYGISENEIYVYYSRNEETGKYVYYGYSLDRGMAPLFASQCEDGVNYCLYSDFKRNMLYPLTEETRVEEKHAEAPKAQTERAEPMKVREMRRLIKEFLQENSYQDMLSFMEERVLDQPELTKVVTGVYHYLECIANGKETNSNILIAAPSGCGKTETFRALRDYMSMHMPKLSVTQIDITSITEEGYKGKDTNAIVEPLYRTGNGSGVGIVFLDEFDKKLVPSFATGGANVNAAVQAQILTLLEGRKVQLKDGELDTSYTMFIGLGSFDACRKNREQEKNGLGFGSHTKEETRDHYYAISREDMIELGASYELLGRFRMIANYYRLSESSVRVLIGKYLNELADSMSVDVCATQELVQYLCAEANGKYGCRMLQSILQEGAMTAYSDILKMREAGRHYQVILDVENGYRIEEIMEYEKIRD